MGPSAVLLLWVAAVATVGCFVVEPGDGVVTVFYSSTSWSQVYIHYDCGLTGVWTTSPGVAMSVSTNTSYLYPPWWVAYLPCNGLEFVFNNGAGTWDNNGGSNYKATLPGIYTVASGTLTTIQTFSKGCVDDCNSHGTCTSSFDCVCDSGWYGSYCSCGGDAPCNKHGSCDAAGNCVCDEGYSTCNDGEECLYDVSEDPYNCGSCGSECLVTGGVASAVCSNGQCTRTCLENYTLCSSGSCIFGDSCGVQPGDGVVTVFYSTIAWNPPYIHYDCGTTGIWTTAPGYAMKTSENTSYPNPPWWVSYLTCNSLEFVFNNGAGSWDNNGGKNYKVTLPGIYTVASGVLSTIQTFNPACASNCSNHGTCSSSYKCECDDGWYGPICGCGGASPCNGHGYCDDDGNCVCNSGWDTCETDEVCLADVSSDPENCGSCGKECVVTTGVKTAVCSNAACTLSCQSGYTLCNDGTKCQYGSTCALDPLPGCQIFYENQCAGNEINTDDSFANHMWYTPWPTDDEYRDSFGDYYRMTAYSHMVYNSARTQATVQIITNHVNSSVTYTYSFGGVMQSSNTKVFTTSDFGPIPVIAYASDGAKIQIQDLDFYWEWPKVARTDGDFRGGQKGAIVEMFGWPDSEIEQECQYVAKMGWAGVKVFPHQEQVMSLQPFNNYLNPWYFMYQPVSYRLEGRMGTHEDLRSLVYTCRKYGVRVYADAVINHMVGSGNDANPDHRYDSGSCTYWPNKNSSAESVSSFYTQGFSYTYNPHTSNNPLQEFPAVPYGPLDFHCERALNSWTDPLDLNAGWLNGLVDLNTERDYVQSRIADYLTSLMSIGFSGFRVDAAKHIAPDDIVGILSKFRANMGGSLPSEFITWLEILLGGEASMLMCNEGSGYNYGPYLEDQLYAAGFSQTEVYQVKIWNSGYPKEPGADCNSISDERNAVQNDDADQQTPGSTSRDMGNYGSVLVIEKDIGKHRGFEEILFNSPYGVTDNYNGYPVRLLLSSYYWPNDSGFGIPDGKSLCSSCAYTCSGCLDTPAATAFSDQSCGYDGSTASGYYTRTHRDLSVILAMRKWMQMDTNLTPDQLGLPSSCTAK